MNILSHRGWWTSPAEKNTTAALHRALAAGFGVETDIRDCDGALVISHDMPRSGQSQPLLTVEEFLDLYSSIETPQTLALNIKSDGLADALAETLGLRGVTNYFLFDMSVPDTLSYLTKGMTVFTRRSEYETGSLLDVRAQGYWLDAFETPYVDPQTVLQTVQGGKKVALVSPELHRRPHLEAWSAWRRALRSLSVTEQDLVSLCTDFPDEACTFYKE